MIKMLSFVLIAVLVPAWSSFVTECAFAKDIIYRGKVNDAETREPIEGAVVVAYWLKAWQTVSGESTELKEVKETLTDSNGQWSIKGPKGKENDPHPYLSFFLLLSYTREPSFIVFKPGYCSWPEGFSIEACQGRLKPAGIGEIMKGETIELPKLNKGEDRLRALRPGPVGGEGALEKQREYIRLLNEERRNLRLPEYKSGVRRGSK
jgi:hypothetical protein